MRQFIAGARWDSTLPPLHDFVEGLEVGPRFPCREETRRFERRELFPLQIRAILPTPPPLPPLPPPPPPGPRMNKLQRELFFIE